MARCPKRLLNNLRGIPAPWTVASHGDKIPGGRSHGSVTEVHRLMLVIERVLDGSAFLWPDPST
jgi:hypothetical protein